MILITDRKQYSDRLKELLGHLGSQEVRVSLDQKNPEVGFEIAGYRLQICLRNLESVLFPRIWPEVPRLSRKESLVLLGQELDVFGAGVMVVDPNLGSITFDTGCAYRTIYWRMK